ncbi:hypothetical protein [Candidatus Deianiraea vastatrix]|nr:hypothetical protein [Candidatus Deianiraea vastatrix]
MKIASCGFIKNKNLITKERVIDILLNDKKWQEIIDTINNQESLNLVTKAANNILTSGAQNIVIVGIGGSILAARAIYEYAKYELKLDRSIHFLDNLTSNFDTNSLPKDAFFIFISKSGKTIETLTQMCYIINHLSKSSVNISKHCLLITQNNNSEMGKIAHKNNISILPWSADISGRFSCFSNNSNLISILCGINIKDIFSNLTKYINTLINNEQFIDNINLSLNSVEQKCSSNILMTYDSRLSFFIDWYIQIWSESLGKENIGTMPSAALGPIDQHSKLQLFLDGPKDKIFTIFANHAKKNEVSLDWNLFDDCNIDYIKNNSIDEIIHASFYGTYQSMVMKNLPVRIVEYDPKISFIFEIMAYSMIETIIACHFFNVNPYNQPAVEKSKEILYNELNKKL